MWLLLTKLAASKSPSIDQFFDKEIYQAVLEVRVAVVIFIQVGKFSPKAVTFHFRGLILFRIIYNLSTGANQ